MKPSLYQDYTNVVKEILDIISKYDITLLGFNRIMEAVKNEIEIYTFINVGENFKEKN